MTERNDDEASNGRVHERLICKSGPPLSLDFHQQKIKKEYEIVEKALCKIHIIDEVTDRCGNGFFGKFCDPSGRYCITGLFTTNRILPVDFIRDENNALMLYYTDIHGNKIHQPMKFHDFGFRFTCPLLDVTFLCCGIQSVEHNSCSTIFLGGPAKLYSFNSLELLNADPCDSSSKTNDQLCILWYNFENHIRFASSLESADIIFEAGEAEFNHEVMTENSTCGAPIVRSSDGRVIGMHKAAEDEKQQFNIGLFTHVVVQAIESYLLSSSAFQLKQPHLVYNPKSWSKLSLNDLSIIEGGDDDDELASRQFCVFQFKGKLPLELAKPFQCFIPTQHKWYVSSYNPDSKQAYVVSKMVTYEYLLDYLDNGKLIKFGQVV